MYAKLIIYLSTILVVSITCLNIGYDIAEKDNERLLSEYREINNHLRKRIDTLLTVKGAIYDKQ